MATEFLKIDKANVAASERSLLLIWQNPTSRLLTKVGQLDALAQGRFTFHYFKDAWADPQFQPLVEFPDKDRVYSSQELPAFFSNRIRSPERSGYGTYLRWLGIEGLQKQDVPLEVLARTGGGRATDTFHIVETPLRDSGRFTSRFFVSGVRYTADADCVLAGISSGDRLKLHLEGDNPVNIKAVIVDHTDGRKVGYVPNWLCDEVHDLVGAGWTVTAVAERVNRDAPAHARLLCKIEAIRA
ncbi:HIRAN domain-containing protein [Salinibacterium sp. NYA9b]